MDEPVKCAENLEKSIGLTNGLTLKLRDKSRVVAGDRWKISVIAQVDVSVEKAFCETKENRPENVDEIKAVLGESVRFEKKMERFFIDEKEKDAIVQGLMDSLTESLLPYLSHPRFCRRLIFAEFVTAKQKKTFYNQQ